MKALKIETEAMSSAYKKAKPFLSGKELDNATKQHKLLQEATSVLSGKKLDENFKVDAQISELQAFSSEMENVITTHTEAASKWKAQVDVLNKTFKTADSAFEAANKHLAGSKDLDRITRDYSRLKDIQATLTSKEFGDHSEIAKAISDVQQYTAATMKATEAEKKRAAANKTNIASMQRVAKLSADIQTTLSKNTKLKGTTYAGTLNSIMSSLSGGTVSNEEFSKLNQRYQTVIKEATAAGKMGKSFGTQLRTVYDRLLAYGLLSSAFYKIASGMKDIYNNVVSIDSAMTQLRKVTDETNSTYDKFFDGVDDRAKTIGATMSDTINASADFARLGYDIDTASKMADAALVYKNVGDNITDISQASESLTSTIQAFKEFGIEATDAMEVVDRFNEVGNNFAISSDGIGEALQRSASALAAGNNNLDESIGLITAANTIAQDPKKVGTTLKTISMYLRSSKTELEDAGESTDGMVESVSKLRGELLALTGGKVDIIGMNGAYKSTYEILRDLSAVWDELSDLNQANILEKIGGKRNANITSAIIKNFDIAERAMETSANSAGSALRENEKYLDSINGRIAVLKATWEDFSQSVLSTDAVKASVSGLSEMLNIVTKITNMFSSPALLSGGFVAFKEIAKAVKGNGLFQYDPLSGASINQNSGLYRMSNVYKQMRTDGLSIRNSAKETVATWWRGPKDAIRSYEQLENVMNNMIHHQKEIERLESYGGTAHDAQLRSEKAKLDVLSEKNQAVKQYLDIQKEIEKGGGQGDYSIAGLKKWGKETGQSFGFLGARATMAAAGMKALSIAGAAIEGLAVAFVMEGIVHVLGMLHKSLFTTAEEMQTATAGAQDYLQSMQSISDYQSQIDQAREVYDDPSASLQERHAAYEQISAIQSELIEKYGAEAAGLELLTSSAEQYKQAMSEIRAQEAYDFLYGNNFENLEGVDKAMKEVAEMRHYFGKLGAFNEGAYGADTVIKDIQTIADKYDDVSYKLTDDGWVLDIYADPTQALDTINDIQKDIQTYMSDWKAQGIDASSVYYNLGNTTELFAGAYSRASEVVEKYGETAEGGIQARIALSDDYSRAADEIMTKEQALKDALSGDYASKEDKVAAITKAMQDLENIDLSEVVGESWGKNAQIDRYLERMLQDAKDAIGDEKFELDLQASVSDDSVHNTVSDLNDKLKSAVGDMDIGRIKDLWDRFSMEDTKGMTQNEIDAMKALRNVTKEYNITVDDLLYSLKRVGVAQGDITALAYNSAEELSKATSAYEQAAAGATLNASLKNIGENHGVLAIDDYKNLIAASSDFSKAIDYENGYVTLNIEKAHELAKAKAEVAKESIKAQKETDTGRYKANIDELNELLSKTEGKYTEGVQKRIDALQAENEAIASNIGMYNVYMSELSNMSSAYSTWKGLSESNNSNVVSNDMIEAIKYMKQSRKKGQTGVGNVQYQMAVEMLVPDDVEVADVGKYINNKLGRYFKENHPEQGVQNWLTDMVEAGWMTKDGDSYELIDTANIDAAAKSLHITRDAMEALVGLANMYAQTEIKFNDPEDISNGMNILNDYTAKLEKLQQLQRENASNESIKQAKQDVSDVSAELAELPEDTRIALGVQVLDSNGKEIKPSEVTDEIVDSIEKGEGKYTIEIKQDGMAKLTKSLDDINNFRKKQKLLSKEDEGYAESMEYYNSKIKEATANAKKLAKQELGLDVDITSIDGLLTAMKEVGDDADKKHIIDMYFKMHGDVELHEALTNVRNQINDLHEKKEARLELNAHADTSDIDAQIAELEERRVTLEAEFDVENRGELDAAYTEIEGLMKRLNELKKSGTPDAALEVETDEAVSRIEELNEKIVELGGEPVQIPIEWDKESQDFQEMMTKATEDGVEIKVRVRSEQIREELENAVDGLYLSIGKDGSVSIGGGVTGEKMSPTTQAERPQPSNKHAASKDRRPRSHSAYSEQKEANKGIEEATDKTSLLEKASAGAIGIISDLFSIDRPGAFNEALGSGTETIKANAEKFNELKETYDNFTSQLMKEKVYPLAPDSNKQIDEADKGLQKLNKHKLSDNIPFDLQGKLGEKLSNVFGKVGEKADEALTPVAEKFEEIDAWEFTEKVLEFNVMPIEMAIEKLSELSEMSPLDIAIGFGEFALAPLDTIINKLLELTGIDVVDIVFNLSTTLLDDALSKLAEILGFSGKEIVLNITAKGIELALQFLAHLLGIEIDDKTFNVTPEGAEQAISVVEEISDKKIEDKKFSIFANGGGALSVIGSIVSGLAGIHDKTFTVRANYVTSGSTGVAGVKAKGGRLTMATGTTNAPGGRALTGELGPEMVVSKGRYYLVGQKGAEFVNLKHGDIVFNHIDTARILSGKTGARGQALAAGGVAMSSGSINLKQALSSSSIKTSKSSSKKSSKSSKSLTSSSKKATDSLDKKIEELEKELSKILENFDSAVEVALKQHADIGDIIKTYKDAQNAIHDQAEKYRKKGIDENSKYMNDLKKQWYDYADKIADAIKETYEHILEEYENIAEKSEKRVAKALQANQAIDAHKYLQDWIDALNKQQEILHEEAEEYRAQGFAENSDEVSEVSMKWWDLEEEKLDAVIDMYDAINDQLEETIDLYEHMFEVSTGEGDRHNMQIAQSYILGSLKAQQDVLEKQIIAYRNLGYSDFSEEIVKLKNEWYKVADAVDEARDKMIESLGDIVKAASDAVDKIQDVYQTLHDAADEYKENGGYISVDTFQDLIELGPQYMQYLQDENGLLVINEENVKKVIAAKTEQMAVESALSYVEQVKTAFLSEDAQKLNSLLFATEQATDGTWGFVYANAALLKTMGLSEEQYSAMMWNIDALRSVAENAVAGIDQIEKKGLDAKNKALDNLEDMQDNLDNLIEYVMDMLEDRLDDQIDKLEDLKDEYEEIIDLKQKSLRITKEENDYQKDIADKIKEASKLQSQIQALSYDDSREAKAQRRKLEEQLADIQNEIADKQADYALDRQEDMLDDMADAYRKQKDDEIEELEKTYSSKEKLYQAASEYLSENWETIYQELLDWNYEQGSVLNREITEAWRNAQKVANEYGTDVKSITEQITKDIEKIKEEIDSIDTDDLNFIVSQLSDHDKSYSDEDTVRAIINMMEENSADWINGNQSTTHVSNVMLSKLLSNLGIDTEYEDKTGEWYLSGTNQRLYDLKGSGYSVNSNKATSEVDEKTALEDIRGVANSMRANSAAWFKSDKKEDLAQENVDMAAGLKSKYGFVIEKTKDGEWIIKKDPYNSKNVGRRFYDTYHKGGIVGRMGTVKQNEMIAKLEKGEAVLDKKKESGVIRLLDFASSIADKVDDVMSNSAFSGIMSNQLLFDTGAFGSVTQPQIYNVNFGDTYITGTSEENIKAHQKITRDFANDVLKQLNIRK